MKINKVEQLVGITKKNIRFYEEKGLITPARNEENMYREYSDADVDMLLRVKLLRQLSIPIDEIAKLQNGYLTLEDCMRRHRIYLEREEENLRQKKSICQQIEESKEQLLQLDTEKYIQLMKEMEDEGVRFMNVNHVDKKRKAPIISAITMIIIMIATIALLVWANTVDPLPLVFIALIIAIPVVVIIGVLLALRDRMRQIEGGEEDAASKY